MNNSLFDILFNGYHVMRAKVKHGSEFRLIGRNQIYAQNRGEITFGDKCTLVSSAKVNPVGGYIFSYLC